MVLSISPLGNAASNPTIKFFSSNNTQEISVEKAYERLIGDAQHKLTNDSISILQTNHFEQGKFEKILGMYQMANDKNATSDNTEIFYASPLQNLSDNQVFSFAAQLANNLNQESVAVFIPSTQAPSGDIIVKFTSQKPRMARKPGQYK